MLRFQHDSILFSEKVQDGENILVSGNYLSGNTQHDKIC